MAIGPRVKQETGRIQCDRCPDIHPAHYSHEGRFGEGPIYAVVCTADGLTDYWTSELLMPPARPKCPVHYMPRQPDTWMHPCTCSSSAHGIEEAD